MRPAAAARLGNLAAELGPALTEWAHRDDTKPQPEIRQAASTALDVMDQMMAVLYQARQVLVTEVRASDDAAAGRADALLRTGGSTS